MGGRSRSSSSSCTKSYLIKYYYCGRFKIANDKRAGWKIRSSCVIVDCFLKNMVQNKNGILVSVILIIKPTNTGVWMRDVFRRVGVLSIWYRSIRHFIFRFIFEQPTRYFKLIASHKYKQLQTATNSQHYLYIYIFIYFFVLRFVLCFCSLLAFKRGNICSVVVYYYYVGS